MRAHPPPPHTHTQNAHAHARAHIHMLLQLHVSQYLFSLTHTRTSTQFLNYPTNKLLLLPNQQTTPTAQLPNHLTNKLLLLRLQVVFKVDLWRADMVTNVLEVDSTGRVVNEQDMPHAMTCLYPPGALLPYVPAPSGALLP